MTRVWSGIKYGFAVTLSVVVGAECLLQLIAVDPSYYWQYRIQFSSPGAFENHDTGLWTYRPHAAVREVAIYGLPSGFTRQLGLKLEYDCRTRSNSLGLLQDNDIQSGTAVTLVLGDSFTSGQGGCPWFHKLQARRPQDQLLNGGLPGTGFAQWWQLLGHLRSRGVIVERVLIISISNDFKRTPWNWSVTDLDCVDRDICSKEGFHLWEGVRPDETQEELIERARSHFAKKFAGLPTWRFGSLYLQQQSLLLKFINKAVKNVSASTDTADAGVVPETGAALVALGALDIPIKVLMVDQRNEVGFMGDVADSNAAVAILGVHGLNYDWCRLNKADYMTVDGHPNATGYDKLMTCADRVLSGMK